MKITSLVAVLALCCAALAGSAYAYTATYVDTIDPQDIDDVYAIVSAVDGEVGALDVDLEYNTVKDGINTYTGYDAALFYKLDAVSITDKVTPSAAVKALYKIDTENTNKVRICILVDTVTITAHGDDSVIDSISVTSGAAGVAARGAAAFLYLATEEFANANAMANVTELTTKALNVPLADSESTIVYAYLIIDVDQLTGGTACVINDPVVGDYRDYLYNDKIGDITIEGFKVAYTATAHQATASA